MLRTTINLRHAVDINSYHNLKSFLKNLAKGYQPKKAQVLTLSQINDFLNNFDDLIYLAKKVNIEDTGNQLIVTIKDNKNHYPRSFIIGKEYHGIVKKYTDLRPKDIDTRRFFINYQMGKCTCQVIGKNKISEVPKIVAICLRLENPETYTGHCFRRLAATILANSGANITTVKQLGG
ncbi:GSCOCG00012621001-RA-CDS, partial [Cotesia congregata]